jgi:hypothetical protein
MRAVRVLMMEAAGTSETPVNFYQTTGRNIPEAYLYLRIYSRLQYSANEPR